MHDSPSREWSGCISFFVPCATCAVPPFSHPIRESGLIFFSPALRTRKFHQGIDDEILDPEAHRLATGGPARPSRPRLGHGALHFRSRSTSCFCPLSTQPALFSSITQSLFTIISPCRGLSACHLVLCVVYPMDYKSCLPRPFPLILPAARRVPCSLGAASLLALE
jgi:hypothetical protein